MKKVNISIEFEVGETMSEGMTWHLIKYLQDNMNNLVEGLHPNLPISNVEVTSKTDNLANGEI